jgi:2-C-methyl-D-erythritol 4-phosphate cytidylyltransferase
MAWTRKESQVYCKKNLRKLHEVIQSKIRGMLTSGVVLLHDSARPLTAAHTRALSESFLMGVVSHTS